MKEGSCVVGLCCCLVLAGAFIPLHHVVGRNLDKLGEGQVQHGIVHHHVCLQGVNQHGINILHNMQQNGHNIMDTETKRLISAQLFLNLDVLIVIEER